MPGKPSASHNPQNVFPTKQNVQTIQTEKNKNKINKKLTNKQK